MATMKAVTVKDGKGPISNLQITDVPKPTPTEDGQVLIKVKAFGVNRMDIYQREGHYPVPPNTTEILGVEFSGTIAELGPGVQGLNIGDEVFGLTYGGAYAEYVIAYYRMVLPKPSHLTWTEAAGIPENWITAYQALFTVGRFQKGENVLIHGGASGVGTAAIQLASFGGGKHVISTAGSDDKTAILKTLNYPATTSINYRTEDFAQRVKEVTEGKGVDVIIDFIGKDYWHKNIDSLALDGRMVHLGFMSGPQVEGFSILPILYKRLSILGTTLRSRSKDYQSELLQSFKSFALDNIRGGHEDPKLGGLHVVIYKVFPISAIQDAHREMEENKNSGKIIVEIN